MALGYSIVATRISGLPGPSEKTVGTPSLPQMLALTK